MPGMYAVTSTPVVRRTRATLRSAEFGFFGVWVNTRVQTPRRCGEPLSAGVFVFSDLVSRPLRTSWAIVGTRDPSRDFSGRLPEWEPRRILGRILGRMLSGECWGGPGRETPLP